ncbi:MAG: alpha/beta hydrolase family protein [Promethearchaeota archaeon]
MKDIRIYLFFIFVAIDVYAIIVLYQIAWILALIVLGILIYNSIDKLILYMRYLWWPYHRWISRNVVGIEKVEIPSALEGEYLKAFIIRPKNMDKNKKYIGVLFHHGYTGFKEKVLRFAIPLAMNGCVVLCPDARGHGETKSKALSMDDFKGIMEDVTKEIDYLENLPEVDKDKLCMMGHSMGGIMTLSAGYKDERLKKLVAISAPYDMLEMFKKHKTIITKFIHNRVTKYLKKSKEFIESGASLDDWNKIISAKYTTNYETSIPDRDRVYLVHCKEDDLVLFEEAQKLKEKLNLPDENVLFMDMPKWKYPMAAHNLSGQATLISTFCVQVAKSLEQ